MSGKNINFDDKKNKNATFIKIKREKKYMNLMLIIY